MQTDRSSPFNGTGTMERPVTGDSTATSTRLGNTKLTSAVYEDSQIVKALFVALRTAVPRDVRLELLHSSADELKFLIAAQPRVSSFSHRQRHSLRHPALSMATKRFYFRRRERQAAYEQYMQEQQQQELAAQQAAQRTPQDDTLDGDELLSPASMELGNSVSFASGVRRAGRKGAKKKNGQTTATSPGSSRANRSASISITDRINDTSLPFGAPTPSSLGGSYARRGSRAGVDAAVHGFSDGNDWCDFSMSVSNALWNYRRPSQASSSRLYAGGAADWGMNGSNTLSSIGGGGGSSMAGRRRQSLSSIGSMQSGAASVFGVFNTSVPALRALEADRYHGMKRGSEFGGGLAGRGPESLVLRSSVRSLLTGDGAARLGRAPHANRSRAGDSEDDNDSDYPLGRPGASALNAAGRRGRHGRKRSSLGSSIGSDHLGEAGELGSRARDRFGATATGFDTAEEHEYHLYQLLEEERWGQLGFCYDLLLRTSRQLTGKAALMAAGDALVNDAIRRFWERVTISPAAEDVHRQEQLKASKAAKTNSVDAGAKTGPNSNSNNANPNANSTGAKGGEGSKAAGKRGGTTASARGAADKKKKNKPAAAPAAKSAKSRASPAPPPPTAKAKAKAKAAAEESPADREARHDATPVDPRDPAASSDEPRAETDAFGGDAETASGPTTEKRTTKKKKKSKDVPGSNLPNVAAYMTPMQYIYLNMRIAQVLLPQRKELEVEMLESVQEDLIIDATYEPRAGPATTSGSPGPSSLSARGSPPGASEVDGSRASSRGGTASEVGAGAVSYFGPPPQWLLSRGEPLLLSGRAFAKDRGGAVADHQARLSRQRSRSRDGDDEDDDRLSESGRASDGIPGTSGAGGVVAPWNPDRLPSIHYSQFWLSMLELADNWTCSAGNPVDMYIFLLELYGEVFGHEWDDADEQLVKALRAASATPRNAAKEAALVQNMQDALQSFHDLVKELDDLTSSSSDSEVDLDYGSDDEDNSAGDSASDGSLGSGDDDDPFLRKKRRRHAKRRARRRQREQGSSGSDDDADGAGRKRGDDDDGADDGADDREGGHDWRYMQRVGKDGRVHYYRRRVDYTKSRRRLQREAEARARGDDLDDLSDHDSDLSVYMIEEELNKQKRVIHRRRVRCHLSAGDLKRVRERLRRQARRKARKSVGGESDAFMYEADGHNPAFRRRKFFDSRPRKKRKLENGAWAEDYDMDEGLSETSSWSSFNDEEGREGGHMAGGRRGRTRHRGPRREKRRYGRAPGFYYDEDASDTDDEDDDDILDDDDLLDNFSELSQSVVSDVDVKPKKRAGGRGSRLDPLTAEEREELRRKKKWLQETLAERGIHIADETFTDPEEEPLLYELLQMTERLMKRKRAKDPSAPGGGAGDEEDDIGMADFDAALLAKLFAKPKQYTLDELQQSALMEKLLRMGEELGADKMPLTSKQLDDVLAALLNPGAGRAVETTSMRQRRERLIRDARELRANMKRAEKEKRRRERAEQEAERLRLEEEEEAAAAAAAEAEKAKETFGLTGVPGLEGRPTSGSASGRPGTGSSGATRSPPADGLNVAGSEDAGERPFSGLTTSSLRVPSAPPRRPFSGSAGSGRGRLPGGGGFDPDGSLNSPLNNDEDYDTYFQLHPLTAAQRKEQERLFKEFEEFTVDGASEGGKYKVTFTAYTPEQFEAFYRHLHLGPQQRALLRGRAPLAPATSLQGGTYHQLPTLNNNRNVGVRYGFTLGSAQVRKQYVWAGFGDHPGDGAGGGEVLKPAPVKLFTLTTKDTLAEAIEENFSSYLDDRAYKDSLAPGQPQPQRPTSSTSSRPHSSPGTSSPLASHVGLSRTGMGVSGGPLPSASATLLPAQSLSGSGPRGRLANAAAAAAPASTGTQAGPGGERLPRIGIGFRHHTTSGPSPADGQEPLAEN